MHGHRIGYVRVSTLIPLRGGFTSTTLTVPGLPKKKFWPPCWALKINFLSALF